MKKNLITILLTFILCLTLTGCEEKYYCYDGHKLEGNKCTYSYFPHIKTCNDVSYMDSDGRCVVREVGQDAWTISYSTPIYSCAKGDKEINGICYEEYEAFSGEVYRTYEIEDSSIPLTKQEMQEIMSGIHKYLKEKVEGKGIIYLSDIILNGYVDEKYSYCEASILNFKEEFKVEYNCSENNSAYLDKKEELETKQNIIITIKGKNITSQEKEDLTQDVYDYLQGNIIDEVSLQELISSGYISKKYYSCTGRLYKDGDKIKVDMNCKEQ